MEGDGMKIVANVVGCIGCLLFIVALALLCRAGYLSSKGPEWRATEMYSFWLGAFIAGMGFFCVSAASVLSVADEEVEPVHEEGSPGMKMQL